MKSINRSKVSPRAVKRMTLGSLLAVTLLLGLGSNGFAECPKTKQCPHMQTCPQTKACPSTGRCPIPQQQPVSEQLPAAPLTGQTEIVAPSANVAFQSTIDPAKVSPGETVRAVTQSPIMVGNNAYPAGTVLTGQVTSVQRPDKCNAGQVQMAFTGLVSPNGDIGIFAQPTDTQSSIALDPTGTPPGFFSRAVNMPVQYGKEVLKSAGGTVVGTTHNVVDLGGGVVRNAGGAVVNTATLQAGPAVRNVGLLAVAPFQGAANIVTTGVKGTTELVGITGRNLLYVINPNWVPAGKIPAGTVIPVSFGQAACPQVVKPCPAPVSQCPAK